MSCKETVKFFMEVKKLRMLLTGVWRIARGIGEGKAVASLVCVVNHGAPNVYILGPSCRPPGWCEAEGWQRVGKLELYVVCELGDVRALCARGDGGHGGEHK